MTKFIIIFLKKLENLSALSCKMTVWTGKSKTLIHPKHLISQDPPLYLSSLKKTDTVLDLGCHAGEHSIKITPIVKKVVGVDYDEKYLRLAQQKKTQKHLKNITFKKVDLEKKFPFKNNSFDKVLFLDVIEHLTNREQALSEIYRILKRKGVLVMAAPNRDTSWKKLQKKVGLFYYSDPDHKYEFTKRELVNLTRRYKFQVLSITPIVYDSWVNPLIDLTGGVSLKLYQKLSEWKKRQAVLYPNDCVGFLLIASK